jgi:hypothetical protein
MDTVQNLSFNYNSPSFVSYSTYLKEMNTRNLPGVKARWAHKADNLATICEPIG